MGLRIWHQSFTTLSDVPVYRDGLRSRIAQIVRGDTEVVLHGQIPGTYTSDYPGADLAYSALFWLHGLQWIAAAREAERQGFDAIVCATMSNPLVRELRTLVDIPVIGYGETTMHLSGLFGRRFGLLCFMAARLEFWTEATRQWGVAERFVGAAPAGVEFRDILDAFGDTARRDEVVAKIKTAAEKFVRDEGVDVLIPSEMPLNLLLAVAGVSDIGGATVMDGLAISFKTAEMLADLRKLSGMKPSNRGYFHSRPDAGRVDQVLKFYGLDALGGKIQPD
jgi:Asp/Glu/hydantoin racemase